MTVQPVVQSLSNESWLTITLSALTVSLAVLAAVVAVMSIWGFSNIKAEAKRSAEDAAQRRLSEYLDSEKIQAKLKEEIASRVGIEADKLYADIALSFAYPPPKKSKGPETEQRFGKEYPSGS